MLEDQDLQKIGQEVGKVIEQNINPQFEKIGERLDKIESSMATRDFITDKLANLEGSVIVRQKKQDEKVNTLVGILRERDLITDTDVERLKEFKIFPSADELV